MKVGHDEMQAHADRTSEFVHDALNFELHSIKRTELEIEKVSVLQVGEDKIRAFQLCQGIIHFIMKCKSGVKGNHSKSISERLVLLVNYYQSMYITEKLVLRGQYIAASALMKKDFETMVRIKEIIAGPAKSGKTPNVKHAPDGLKFIYGQLNDIAHVSKDHVLGFYLEKDDINGKGVTATPQFKTAQCNAFYVYLMCIAFEITSDAIGLYKDMYGMDEDYKVQRIYHKILYEVINGIEQKELLELVKQVDDGN